MKKIGSFEFPVKWLILFSVFTPIVKLAYSLECIYCPTHTTEDECNEMDLTQICIKETKCGYARFIEKRKDLGQHYPANFDKEIFSVTVKRGCMNEDYCTTIDEDKDSSLNSTECIFCDEDLCILKFPILCVECDEAVDKFCPIQTEPIVKCPPGEVCFRQRTKENNTQKRGCMGASHCRKQDFCEYCKTDLCWTDPISYPVLQQQPPVVEVNKTKRTGRKAFNHSNSGNSENIHLRLMVIVVLNFLYI